MPSKNISIKKSTYDRLTSLKRKEESFSDLLNRLTREETPKYADLAGILSEDTVEAIEEIRKVRKKRDKEEMKEIVDNFGVKKK